MALPTAELPREDVPVTGKRWYTNLYGQVLVALLLGILVGHVFPAFGESLKPLGDGFIKLVKMFIAQATNTPLGLEQQILLLLVAMISSKVAAGVTGSGFVTLAATRSVVPSIPIAAMALILGIDRFMSECRALTNFIGNAIATLVVARWEGAIDDDALTRELG